MNERRNCREMTVRSLFYQLIRNVHEIYQAVKADDADAIVSACAGVADTTEAIAEKAAGRRQDEQR